MKIITYGHHKYNRFATALGKLIVIVYYVYRFLFFESGSFFPKW